MTVISHITLILSSKIEIKENKGNKNKKENENK